MPTRPPDENLNMITDGLAPIREVLEKHNLWARKGFGQNFILDLNLTRRIARCVNTSKSPLKNSHIIEIGAGPGGLTRGLLMEGAKKVTVIEADARFLPILEDIRHAYPNRLEIIIGDALKHPPASITTQPYKIVSNLPYNVGTPLLISWLRQTPLAWESLTLMFQKEVAQRICATVGDKHYGRLSVLTNWLTQTHILFDVPPQVFVPAPKVTSAIVQLFPRSAPLAQAHIATLEKVTMAAFGQRRKMLRASLKQLTDNPQGLLAQAEIDETARAENLTIEEFCALARHLERHLENP